jgi:uncharacterized cupredoxin-like copper-binding protein
MTRMLIAAGLAAAISSVASAQAIPVTVSEWKIQLSRDTVRAGAVTFRVKNEGAVVHGFRVEGPGVENETPQIAVGQSASLRVTLKPGTYELYCPMSENSHKLAGMTKKITVVAGEAEAPKKP